MRPLGDFAVALAWILEAEGGYVKDPRDPGGETKFGISKRSHPHLDIATLTVDDAARIYREQYWTPIHGAEMPAPWALVAFDAAVLQGPRSSVMTLQSVVGVDVDGSMGPLTMEAVHRADTYLIARYLVQRSRFLRRAPGAPVYLDGWLSRLFRLALRCGALIERDAP